MALVSLERCFPGVLERTQKVSMKCESFDRYWTLALPDISHDNTEEKGRIVPNCTISTYGIVPERKKCCHT